MPVNFDPNLQYTKEIVFIYNYLRAAWLCPVYWLDPVYFWDFFVKVEKKKRNSIWSVLLCIYVRYMCRIRKKWVWIVYCGILLLISLKFWLEYAILCCRSPKIKLLKMLTLERAEISPINETNRMAAYKMVV